MFDLKLIELPRKEVLDDHRSKLNLFTVATKSRQSHLWFKLKPNIESLFFF